MSRELSERTYGKSALWILTGSVITRGPFDVNTNKVEVGNFYVCTNAPNIYAISFLNHPDFVLQGDGFTYNPNLLRVSFGKLMGFEGGELQTASFREMRERDLIEDESKVLINLLKQEESVVAYGDPLKSIGRGVQVMGSTHSPTLYKVKKPLLMNHLEDLA